MPRPGGSAALLILATLSCAHAQPAPATLALQGQIAHPHSYTLAELRALPSTHVDVTTISDHDPTPKQSSYDGVLLWSLIDSASLIDAPGRKTRPLHVFTARGADGYAVAIAIGEVAPMYEGKQAIIAYARNGKQLDGLELIVPGDRRPARFVKNLAAIDIR